MYVHTQCMSYVAFENGAFQVKCPVPANQQEAKQRKNHCN